jgi:hypothetical protein
MPRFFIVGSARSGTTLMRLILNAHPEIAVPPESRFIVELYGSRPEVEVEAFLKSLAAHKRFQTWNLPIESVGDQLDAAQTVPYSEAVEAAYRAFAQARGKSICGDKTPRYIERMALLSNLFPAARFLHMVRDGRNVALSYADVPFGPKTVGRAAALWASRVSMGRAAGRSLGPARYIEVRYEDFVAAPAARLKEICDFIDVQWSESMLEHASGSRTDILPNSALYNPNVTRPPTSDIRSWEEQMPARLVEIFEAVAGETLDDLGYDRRCPRPGRLAKAVGVLSERGLPVARLPSPGRSAKPSEH